MRNVRFATSLHILLLLDHKKDELVSSEYIASSININPVVVRKELSNLRSHGLIVCKEGKGGGSRLARPASKILLSDVYKAVRQEPLLGRFNNPNADCTIGKQMNTHIANLYAEAEEVLIKRLEKKTLADFSKQFK